MTFELDPHSPEDSDGGLAAPWDDEQAGPEVNRARVQAGDFSDLNQHDKCVIDEFLATLR
ncbi:hypothetical protein ACWDYH_05590 [Nocardia goodfellowii]|uniref:Uncharacterized protein n=1 Tax=Nocardia goodfellowii TaxID=882446 RepID=A0ABS4Q9U2_9NOCA|nr:hypothetical protein [Nocardia goodfellowii]MBP2188464.1 hypothetical protein [Nocardia goodfellowii]